MSNATRPQLPPGSGASGGPSKSRKWRFEETDISSLLHFVAQQCFMEKPLIKRKKKKSLLAVVALYKQDWLIVLLEFILISSWESGKCFWGAFSSLVGGDSADWQLLWFTSLVPKLAYRGGCSLPPELWDKGEGLRPR